jgi:inorganic pyrophosphatase
LFLTAWTQRWVGVKRAVFDPKFAVFTLAKPLLVGLIYPYDWGFIPSTKADDGDPLDVMMNHDGATYPGVVLKSKPIGILEVNRAEAGQCATIACLPFLTARPLKGTCRTYGIFPNARLLSLNDSSSRLTRSKPRSSGF